MNSAARSWLTNSPPANAGRSCSVNRPLPAAARAASKVWRLALAYGVLLVGGLVLWWPKRRRQAFPLVLALVMLGVTGLWLWWRRRR
ncbi:Loki-CTERM sorting domain-containing protein [Roseateles sp. LYH14W]|uniref:Loki-CTERM sorting domain-containing protein n=1 Tax=Pelomonas parva TaxID=3299032 RepID=A0ABW7EZ43_9BURK